MLYVVRTWELRSVFFNASCKASALVYEMCNTNKPVLPCITASDIKKTNLRCELSRMPDLFSKSVPGSITTTRRWFNSLSRNLKYLNFSDFSTVLF